MSSSRSGAWRWLFALAAVLILTGGPMHPSGTMEEMLANAKWVPGHSLVLAGFVALLTGLIVLSRQATPSARTGWWVRLAIVGAVLQTIEMALHTAAVVDHAHLVAGQPTPVLTTHLSAAVVFYPIFGATVIGMIAAGARNRDLGSWWIAWLGILGATAHGLSAPLVVALKVPGAGILFPFLMLLALWLLIVAVWPSR